MAMNHSSTFDGLRQRVRRWLAIPATALALASGMMTTDSTNVVRADEVHQRGSTRSGVEPGGMGANQRSIPNQGAYETMPTRRYRRGGNGRYYYSRPNSAYYRGPSYYGNRYYGPRAYYVPRGGYYGYGYGGFGYPGYYGRGYGGFYGSGGAVGIGPLTFWW